MHTAVYAVIFQPLVFCVYIAEVELAMKINQSNLTIISIT